MCDDVASTMVSARHVIGCPFTQHVVECPLTQHARIQIACHDVASTILEPLARGAAPPAVQLLLQGAVAALPGARVAGAGAPWEGFADAVAGALGRAVQVDQKLTRS